MNASLLLTLAAALAATDVRLPVDVQAAITLTDGSRLVGRLAADADLDLRYQGVALALPWSDVLAATRDGQSHRITRRNGDILTAAVHDDAVTIDTLVGRLTVPIEHIASVAIDPYAALTISAPVRTDTLRDGVKAFNDRTYVYQNVPAELQGMQFIRTRGTTPTQLELTIHQPGLIYGAIVEQHALGAQYMQREGWTRTNMTFQYTSHGPADMIVWERAVEAGTLMLPPIDSEFSRLVVIAPAIDAPAAQRIIAPVEPTTCDQIPQQLSTLRPGMAEQTMYDILSVNFLPMRLVREGGPLDDYTRTYDLGDGRTLQLVFDYSNREDPYHLEDGLFKRGRLIPPESFRAEVRR